MKPSPEPRALWADASSYTALSYGAQLLGAVATLWAARVLGPEGLGRWNLVLLGGTYLGLLQMGFLDAVNREVPLWSARGDAPRARRIEALARTATLLVCGAAWLVLATLCLWVPKERTLHPGEEGIAFLALFFPLQQAVNLLMILMRSHKRFGELGRGALLLSALHLALLPAAAWAGGLKLFMGAYLLDYGFLFLYYVRASRGQAWSGLALGWDAEDFRRVFALGFAMFLGAGTFTLLTTLDRAFAASLGPKALGLYALASTVHAYLFQVPNALSVVTFPYLQERRAREEAPGAGTLKLTASTLEAMGFLVLPLLIGTAFIGVPLLVRTALPDYAQAVPAIKILLAGTFFLSMTPTLGQYLVTMDRPWTNVLVAAGSLAAGAGLLRLSLSRGWGLEGIALSASAAYLVYLLALLGSVRGGLRLASPVLAGAYALGLLWLTDLALPPGEGAWPGLVRATAQGLLYGAGLIPLLLHADRRLGWVRLVPGRGLPPADAEATQGAA